MGVKKFGKFQPCYYRLDVFDQSLVFVSKCWAFDLNAEVEQSTISDYFHDVINIGILHSEY